jgi:hypothetical protein
MVTPTSAPAGSQVTLIGRGFPPNAGVEISIGGIPRDPLDPGTDADGNFVRQRTVPLELPPRPAPIRAVSGTFEALANFTVTQGNGPPPMVTPLEYWPSISLSGRTANGSITRAPVPGLCIRAISS